MTWTTRYALGARVEVWIAFGGDGRWVPATVVRQGPRHVVAAAISPWCGTMRIDHVADIRPRGELVTEGGAP